MLSNFTRRCPANLAPRRKRHSCRHKRPGAGFRTPHQPARSETFARVQWAEGVALPIPGESMEELLKALSQIGNLKDLPRAGWVREQVPHPESVAEHSFRSMVLALVLGPQLGVDVGKVLCLLLVHDLAESDPAVGDITPFDGVAPEEKHRRESAAMARLCAALPNGEDVLSLW